MKSRYVAGLLAALALVFGAATPAVASVAPTSHAPAGVECLRCPL
ncbi:hypothetical protein FB471_6633 [Amycolatopsis cihanbeyliensis]|uniref:Uncharacterized protein n=1 Tax=Amycolatopsis cihanbeyliensis TaxID=1128664 RepID=A0A542CUH3_AMYCI|nr:hypothetical protein FB471_6633 [Amycolatopsis cihanbeyliensis]